VRQLLVAGQAVYGSPYLWQALRPLLPAELPAIYSPGQMPAAQGVVLERLGLGTAGASGGFTD
jgi:beta-glucosidase